MAEERPNDWKNDPLAVLFVLFFVMALLNALTTNLKDRWGIDPANIGPSINSFVSGDLNELSPLGTRVSSSGSHDVFTTPGGALLGTQSEGNIGSIIDGPIVIDGERWWNVDYNEGTDGWVRERDLDVVRLSAALGPNTPIGSAVRSIRESELFSDPGIGTLLGIKPAGILGSLIGGPTPFNGDRWWQVRFDDGVEGWINENSLELVNVGKTIDFANDFRFWFTTVALIFSGILAAVIIVITMRINRIRYNEIRAIWEALPSKQEEHYDEKWLRIEQFVNSNNPNDWKQAILEADSMLDNLVIQLGLTGETMGERLKNIPRGDFATIDLAWEAHLVRNKIAHEGSDFILTRREARRIINLYRQVFDEFGVH